MLHDASSPATRPQVWLLEDDEAYRSTLQSYLQHTGALECHQTFGAVDELLDFATAARTAGMESGWPDIVVVDINLPGVSGTEGLPALLATLPDARFVMLTLHEEADYIFRALERGASGYMTKGTSFDRVVQVLLDAHAGGMTLPPPVARLVRHHFASRPQPRDYNLTDRERDVLGGMVDGLSQKEIGDRLAISFSTVNSHLRSIYEKLHVHSGTAAVSKALRERLLAASGERPG